jgi:hypothetical protein
MPYGRTRNGKGPAKGLSLSTTEVEEDTVDDAAAMPCSTMATLLVQANMGTTLAGIAWQDGVTATLQRLNDAWSTAKIQVVPKSDKAGSRRLRYKDLELSLAKESCSPDALVIMYWSRTVYALAVDLTQEALAVKASNSSLIVLSTTPTHEDAHKQCLVLARDLTTEEAVMGSAMVTSHNLNAYERTKDTLKMALVCAVLIEVSGALFGIETSPTFAD